MATRYYFPSNLNYPVMAPYAPIWGAGGASPFSMVTTPTNSAMDDTNVTSSETVGSFVNMLSRQFISDPIGPQTIDGTVYGIIRASETATSGNSAGQVNIRVMSGDLQTLRGTLYNGDTTTEAEYTVTLSSRMFPGSATIAIPATLTPVTSQSGDRIVIEIGSRQSNTTTISKGTLFSIGDNGGSDFTSVGDTVSRNPFMEFSANIAPYSASTPSDSTLVEALGSASAPNISAAGGSSAVLTDVSGMSVAAAPTESTGGAVAPLVEAVSTAMSPNITSQASASATLDRSIATASAQNITAGVDSFTDVPEITGMANVPILLVSVSPPDYAFAGLTGSSGYANTPNLSSTAGSQTEITEAVATAVAGTISAIAEALAALAEADGIVAVPALLVTVAPPDYTFSTLEAVYATAFATDPESTAGSAAPLTTASADTNFSAPVFGEIFPSFSTLNTAEGVVRAIGISAAGQSISLIVSMLGSAVADNPAITAEARAELAAILGNARSQDIAVVSGATEQLVAALGNAVTGTTGTTAGSVAILSVSRGTGTVPQATVSVLFLPPGPRISNILNAGGAYTTRAVLWRASKDGRKLEVVPITIPVSGVIQVNEDTTPMRSFSLDVNNPRWLAPYKDYVIPEVTQTDAAGNTITRQMGHFIVLPPNTSMRPGRVTGTIEAQDITYILQHDTFDDGLIVPAGTDTGAGARQIAVDGGLIAKQLSLPDTGVLLSSDKYFPPGTSRLSAMTDLYATASWYAPGSNGYGVIYSAPYNSSGALSPRISYSTRDKLMRLVPPIDETPDVGRLRNRVTVRNLQPDKPVIYETVRITNQTHPLYYGNIGIWLSETVDDGQVPDAATARARAAMLLANGASYYRKVEITTVADLDAGLHDVIGLDATQEGVVYDGAWMRKGWKLNIGGVVTTTQSNIYRTESWE